MRFDWSKYNSCVLNCILHFAETPATATERIRFQDGAVRERNPKEIKVTWEKQNLTTNFDAQIRITLYGYREVTIAPELINIDVIAVNKYLIFQFNN